MNRRQVMALPGVGFFFRRGSAQTSPAPGAALPGTAAETPDKVLLKDYRPKSIYKIPKSEIVKAKYPINDVHYQRIPMTGAEPKCIAGNGWRSAPVLSQGADGPRWLKGRLKEHRQQQPGARPRTPDWRWSGMSPKACSTCLRRTFRTPVFQ